MATTALGTVLHNLRRSLLRQDEAGLTDGELLDCFVTRRDEAAFEALLRRHGPMVLGVCRRVLRNETDAEDAFQATFLVLVRKAASIRPRGMVGNWLYGVAHSTALKARAMSTKRLVKERKAAARPKPDVTAETWDQLHALLDQELKALPDTYRAAIVLCDLEGKSIREAARELGWPQGTVATRRARARALLAKRLARHGLALSGGALALALAQGSASACVPTSLIVSTVQAATAVAAGQAAAAGLIPTKVAALTEGVLKAMLMTKLKVLTAVVLAITLLGSGGVLLTCRTLGEEPRPGTNADRLTPAGKEDGKARPGENAKKDKERLQGTWKIVSGERDGESKPPPPGEEDVRIVISGDEATIKKGDQVLYKGKFKLDPSRSPKEMDWEIVETAPPNENRKGKTVRGIYALDGDTLKWCYVRPGAADPTDRPKEFAGKAGTEHSLNILKREKK